MEETTDEQGRVWQRQRIPSTRYGRLVRWCRKHNITAAEMLITPVVLWFGLAIFIVGVQDVTSRPALHKELTDILPGNVWVVLVIVTGLLIVLGLTINKPFITQVGFVASAAFFFTLASLIFIELNTIMTPALYLMVGIACLYRYADIGVGDGA